MTHLPDDRYQKPPRSSVRGAGASRAASGSKSPTAIPRVDAETLRRAAHTTDEEPSGFGRFLGFTSLGTILPGSGLLLAGYRKAGGTLLALVVLAVVGASAYLWVKGPTAGAFALAVDPTFLMIFAVVAVVAAIVIVGSIIWTGVATWPRPAGAAMHTLSSLIVLALCLVVVAPTAIGVRDVVVHRDLLQSLFNQPVFNRTGISPDVGGSDPWADHPRVNVMLIGADSADNRPGTRTDSMMLASIDTRTGDTILFGLPRNLERVPFPDYSPLKKIWPDGFRCAKDCLLNEVWGQGEEHRDLYPGDPKPGVTALNEAVTAITGLTPDYDIVVNMASFTALVEAMGGVDVTVRDRVPIGGKVENGVIVPGSIKGWIEPGRQHLDGYHAMWFARGRATTDDFDRMRRQRCLVGALVKQINPAMMLDRYPQIAKVAKDNIYTNIPQAHLAAWAELATRMQHGTIKSLPFSNKVIRVGNPDFELMAALVQQAVYGTPLPTQYQTATPTRTSTPTRTTTRTPTTGTSTSTSSSPTSDGVVDVAQAC